MKIFDTEETTFQFRAILKEAQDYLLIISPYIGLEEQTIEAIEKAFKRVCHSYVIVRPEDTWNPLKKEYKACDEFFRSVQKCGYGKLNHLHAKIYMNEKECLITSYNPIDATSAKNHEIGVYIKKEDNPEQYARAEEIALKIISKSDVLDKNFAKCIPAKYGRNMGSLYAQLAPKEKEDQLRKEYGDLIKFYEHLTSSALKIRSFAKEEFKKTSSKELLRTTEISISEYYQLYSNYNKN